MQLLRSAVPLLCVAAPAAQGTADPPAAQSAVAAPLLEAKFIPTEAEVFGHVRFLADPILKGRRSGSEQGAIAAAYVAAEMAKAGLAPAGGDGAFYQPFERMQVFALPPDASADAGATTKFEARKQTCRNVLAWLTGTDATSEEFILVGAHFDHLGTRGEAVFAGADDNASGVAGLLAVARALAHGEHRPRRSVLFVAFDAEEQALAGAEHFARHPPRSLQKLVAMINLDMIGRGRLLDRKQMAIPRRLAGVPDEPAVGVLGTARSPELAEVARAVFAADGLPLFAPEDFGMLGAVIEKQADGRSDHAPFERRKIPFLFFSTSENDDYHQPTDTLDKVHPESLWRISRCIYRVVLAIDALEERPTFVPAPEKGEKK